MCPQISQNKHARIVRNGLLALLVATTPPAFAQSGDEVVEQYLREHRMDTLLEVQLEQRIEEAEDETQREALAEQLSSLYVRQLRELDASDPYRQLVFNRAQTLAARMSQAPLYELRLELLISMYTQHEQAIELYRLGLLSPESKSSARESLIEVERQLERMLGSVEPDLTLLDRRRAQPMGSDESRQIDERIESLRRHRSLASYYLGWSIYGLAVLDDRHVSDDALIAFGRLLGADGSVPQSKELSRALLEYEHVSRSAIGVAMCYAQSDSANLATSWLDSLLDSQDLQADVRDAARSRKLQVLAGAGEWYNAELQAREMMLNEDSAISVADARYIAMKALDYRASRSASASKNADADKLARLALEQLVDSGEIGHIVDLYNRYGSLPNLAEGFIPNYAKALGALNAAQAGEQSPGYLAIAELFSQALKSTDAKDHPKHREDCTLKYAYALIRGDRPSDAIEQCQRVIDSTLDPEAMQEARWLIIAAHDSLNTKQNKPTSQALDEAVRDYVKAYPSTQRTAKLVLRHAMRGTVDETVAIDTLSNIADDDPIAIPARRVLVRLLYQRLRTMGFSDQRLLLDTRRQINWLLVQQLPQDQPEESRSRLNTLRLGIDLALRSVPADTGAAEMMIEQASSLLEAAEDTAATSGELEYQRIRIALNQKRHDQAVAMLDPLRAIDASRAQEAEVLVLNALVELWSQRTDSRLAGFIVELGTPVLARVTPKSPERIGLQTSALIETVCHAAKQLADATDDQAQLRLASRLAKQILERGQPSEPGLRRSAQIAKELDDQPMQLESWLRLLAAYPIDDDQWYEARYESLAVMAEVDPDRAKQTFEQFRVLNPQLGPEPWSDQYLLLFPGYTSQSP